MKRNYLIATHGELAKGIQSSLNILAGKGDDVTVINAYMTDEDYTPVIVDFINSIGENEQGVIFTDLFGGSVNQKVVTEVLTAGREDIFILSNINLAIILSILFLPEESAITTEMIQEAINESQVTLVQTNQDDEEEDIF
ncbi:PTS sugar transporter subunit IIA [Vagococcus hydrophili]|uniref:PTS mannose transporter subunit IIA n=1 Tax=Vagococcus hydrophili TaxID=2714947 RepID=A0A6G8AVD5_9ENTE|nr:PTS mannose transporter subunit IIA [Vagococcus hydrophili]QIL49051.1 PTS mannose transporter subunit IIA [Vagococcus hydrophili]